MFRFLAVSIALGAFAGAVYAAEDSIPPAVYKSASELMATLKKSAETRTDQASAPISNQDRYRINIVRRGSPGVAMAHATGPAKGTEVHYIIDGSATVVTGGKLIRAEGAPAAKGAGRSTIEGGETRHVAKGDVVVIPAGTPHWYKEVDGSVTYLEVRFDVDASR